MPSPLRFAALLPLTLLIAALPAAAGTLYVNAGLATGNNDGSSWADAFQGTQGLQSALATAVSGDQIFVAVGRYLPTATTTRTISFALENGVEIYGSFLGNEASLAERPPIGTQWSVLDGDLLGNDGSAAFADNSFHLLTAAGTNSTAVLDGFTVRGGNANGSGSNNDRGGGILIVSAVSPTIRNCLFSDNRCTFGGAAGYINNGGAPTFTDCTFQNGQGGSFGGAFDIAGGGALRFDRCIFRNNTAGRGGGLEIFASTGPQVTNCLFVGNTATSATGGGGGVWVGSGGNPQLRNCTIVGNFSTSQAVAGLRNQSSGGASVANCILFDNIGPAGAQGPGNQANAGTNITYSLVEGGYTGTGNSSADPLFAAPLAGDFRLGAGSPGIDAGNNAALPLGILLDLAGKPRFQDVPAAPDTGVGTAPLVDLGAFESAPPAFVARPGCFGNGAGLQSASPALALNQTATLDLSAGLYPNGLGLLYLGLDGADLSGCGLPLPGLGELLLSLAPAPTLLGSAALLSGQASFPVQVPNTPALVGKAVAFQAANVDLFGAGNPVELSNSLLATIAP
jgi:hypothetical protein